jgi:TolB-like protein/class 3 adenylate cyclase/Tfp pilus assembly protein PilF
MSDPEKTKLRLEIAHILFIDIVGYSRLATDEQSEALHELNAIVRNTEAARDAEAAGELVLLPTGDGMALVFTGSEEDPVECALEIAHALRAKPSLPVRMGIHSGPVHHVTDVNQRENITGAGINIAQRIMDCGDAGHILVSKRVADDLAQSRRWQPYLHDLGDVEVKHGLVVSVVNLYADVVGNAEPPKRFGEKSAKSSTPAANTRSRISSPLIVAGLLLFALAALAIVFAPAILKELRSPPSSSRSEESGRSPATAGSLPAPEKSIAVLPFENLSENKENAFFADGVQDEILTDLAKVADLKVISRSSVMQYRNAATRNLRIIAQQLGVAHLLEGSVQRAANKVRVNAQLIDARNDAHLWAQTYDRDLADVFAIQSEIAAAIAQQLAVHLSPSEKAEIAQPPTTDLVAYDLYRRARELDDLANDPDAKPHLLNAISLLEEAVRRDPKFLRAYCLICEVHLDLYWGGIDHTPERRELARAALEKAESIQPDSPWVHWQKGDYAYHGFRDYDRALTELELARQSLPNESRIYVNIGAIDRRSSRWHDGETNFKRAVDLDPRNFFDLEEAGSTFAGLRQYEEAERMFGRCLDVLPNDPFARHSLGFARFAKSGDIGSWRKELDLAAAQGPESARRIAFLSLLCSWAERDRAAAEKAVALIPPEGAANSFDESLAPREYCVGRTAWTFHDNTAAQPALSAARQIFQRMTAEQPDYPQAWSYLGLTDAMLGRRAEAVEEGKRACEILPLSKDSWTGPGWITNLALIYTICGDKNSALDQLEISARIPAGISYGELKQDPVYDSLRSDPRFARIVASLMPKTSK